MNRSKKTAILLVIGCCMLYGASCGIGVNCRGIFYNPVSRSLGVSLAEMNLAGIFTGVASAITIPISCKLYYKLPCRPYLSIMAFVYCLSVYLLGNANSLAWIYFMSTIQGITGGFLNTYPMQMMIAEWFPSNKGTVMGIFAMSTGVVGAIMNPVITGWIETWDWQTAYHIIGIILLVIAMPVTLFLLHRTPEEVGCTPVVSGHKPKAAAADPTHTTHLDIILALGFVCIIAILNTLSQHMANYAIVANYTAAFGATLVSCTMIGNIVGKLVMGVLNDRLGARASSLVMLFPVIIACIVLVTVPSSAVMCICSCCVGILMSLSSLQIPLITRSCFVPDVYQRLYPKICSINVLLSVSSAAVLSFLLNVDGTYGPVMLFSAVILIICVFCVIILELSQRHHIPKPSEA